MNFQYYRPGAIHINPPLYSNTQIPQPLQLPTIPIIILYKRHIQLHTLDVPKFESVGEERNPGFSGGG